eukprot:Sspe_Gene.37278::Locus_17991_Transcript_1_1_Confidence_1.000_Length_610::g.37278::m.37278
MLGSDGLGRQYEEFIRWCQEKNPLNHPPTPLLSPPPPPTPSAPSSLGTPPPRSRKDPVDVLVETIFSEGGDDEEVEDPSVQVLEDVVRQGGVLVIVDSAAGCDCSCHHQHRSTSRHSRNAVVPPGPSPPLSSTPTRAPHDEHESSRQLVLETPSRSTPASNTRTPSSRRRSPSATQF